MWGDHIQGFGGMWFGGLWMVLFWVLVIVGLVMVVRWLAGGAASAPKPEDRALALLKERYARGEIGDEEFERMRREIER